MKNIRELRYIKEDLFLEIIRNKEYIEINVIDNNEKIHLEKFIQNEFVRVNASSNNNYIIIYTIGYSRNTMPFNIDIVYDINEREIIDIPSYEIKDIIENMFLFEKTVDLETVILLLNGIFDNNKVKDLYNYLTANNSNITIDMVSSFILQKYPELNKYIGIGKESFTIEYFKTTNSFTDNFLYLKVMPQSINDIIKNNNGYVKKLNC